MAVDYFDEVDEKDVPTGRTVTKQEAHDKRLVHRCVAVFVFDSSGKLYVQAHKQAEGRLDHSVGGHVDSGEEYEAAAYRETEEELGITGVQLDEVIVSYYSDEGSYVHMFGIYACTTPEDWVFRPNDEVDTVYPMSIEDIVSDMNTYGAKRFVTGFINTMQKYLEVTNNDLRVAV